MITNELISKSVYSIKDELEYEPGSVVFKPMIKKYTGSVTAFAFDMGKSLIDKVVPFNTMVHVIEGDAEIIVNDDSFLLTTGDSIIIPAHSKHKYFAISRFKMLVTVIKSGFE